MTFALGICPPSQQQALKLVLPPCLRVTGLLCSANTFPITVYEECLYRVSRHNLARPTILARASRVQ